MGLWILDGQLDGFSRAVLVNSVTEMPLQTSCFDDVEEAQSFLDYCALEPEFDIMKANAVELSIMRDRWEMLPHCTKEYQRHARVWDSVTRKFVRAPITPRVCGNKILDESKYCKECVEEMAGF